jgi:glutathione synthase/RimK-type ligase-like ATP-grasp enzyme
MKTGIYFLKNSLYRKTDPGKLRIDCGYGIYKAIKEIGIPIKIDGAPGFRHLNDDDNRSIIVNYGVSSNNLSEFIDGGIYLNHPAAVAKAVDKIETLQLLHKNHVSAVTYTTSKEAAYRWFMAGYKVLCRLTATGKGGEGITLVDGKQDEDIKKYSKEKDFPDAPLYTLYFPKKEEYRYHIFDGKVIDVQQKRRMSPEKLEDTGAEYNKVIRSYDNGWVFCRGGVSAKEQITIHCLAAVSALQLQFAAVDVLVAGNDFRICELNTAPGAEGETVAKYASAISNWIMKYNENN